MKFTKWVNEERTPDQKKAMALMDKVRKIIAKGNFSYHDISGDMSKAISLLKKGATKSEETQVNEVALLAGLADLAEYGKLAIKFGPKAAKKWRAIEKALGELNDIMLAAKKSEKK
jgi:hypothetical protein